MKVIKKQLDELLKEMSDLYLGDSDLDLEDFGELVKLEDVDKSLHNVLILLHSNYKAEFMAIKKQNFKTIHELVTNNQQAYDRLLEVMDENNRILEQKLLEKKKLRVSVFRIAMLALILVGTIGSIWLLFSVDKEAGKMILELTDKVLNAKGG